ncbi:flagellar basal-body rod protein FlgF [Pseudobdellovibrio sp. HCB154]|uniref:flagellar basal-body rod protein FlgF n=1 Tax=Pseudobdellovibrio sp. HCB154 TaxID=3386277 RepID=UPI003917233F
MSLKGIYTALSGAVAQSLKLDTIANNIANVNTTGFKKDQQTFSEYLTALEKEQDVMKVPRMPASIDSFYELNGGDKAFVDAAGTYTNFEQGSLKSTGGKLDVAIDGQGFFEVGTPTGVKFTRAGNFTVDGNGQLVTKDGNPVLLEGGEGEDGLISGDNFDTRTVRVSGAQAITISDAGEVFEGETKLGKLSVVNVANTDALQKVGNNYYTTKENMNAEITAIKNPSLKQGFLETSNVSIINEMTDMIMAQRVFEGTQKAISAYDNMSDKLINQVGNTKG